MGLEAKITKKKNSGLDKSTFSPLCPLCLEILTNPRRKTSSAAFVHKQHITETFNWVWLLPKWWPSLLRVNHQHICLLRKRRQKSVWSVTAVWKSTQTQKLEFYSVESMTPFVSHQPCPAASFHQQRQSPTNRRGNVPKSRKHSFLIQEMFDFKCPRVLSLCVCFFIRFSLYRSCFFSKE